MRKSIITLLLLMLSVNSYSKEYVNTLDLSKLQRCDDSQEITIDNDMIGTWSTNKEEAFTIGHNGLEEFTYKDKSISTTEDLIDSDACIKEEIQVSNDEKETQLSFSIKINTGFFFRLIGSTTYHFKLNKTLDESVYETKKSSRGGALFLSFIPMGGKVKLGKWEKSQIK